MFCRVYVAYYVTELAAMVPARRRTPEEVNFPPSLVDFAALLFEPVTTVTVVVGGLSDSFDKTGASTLAPELVRAIMVATTVVGCEVGVKGTLFGLGLPSTLPSFTTSFTQADRDADIVKVVTDMQIDLAIATMLDISLPEFRVLSRIRTTTIASRMSLVTIPTGAPGTFPLIISGPDTFPDAKGGATTVALGGGVARVTYTASISSTSVANTMTTVTRPPRVRRPAPAEVSILRKAFDALQDDRTVVGRMRVMLVVVKESYFPIYGVAPEFVPGPDEAATIYGVVFRIRLVPSSTIPFSIRGRIVAVPTEVTVANPPVAKGTFPVDRSKVTVGGRAEVPLVFF